MGQRPGNRSPEALGQESRGHSESFTAVVHRTFPAHAPSAAGDLGGQRFLLLWVTLDASLASCILLPQLQWTGQLERGGVCTGPWFQFTAP